MYQYTSIWACWWACRVLAQAPTAPAVVFSDGKPFTTIDEAPSIITLTSTNFVATVEETVTEYDYTYPVTPTAATYDPDSTYPADLALKNKTENPDKVDNDWYCNNSPALCERAYDNVTYAGVHNAPFIRTLDTINPLSGNQVYDSVTALKVGFRLLHTEVHDWSGVPYLCHDSCMANSAGSLQDWLGTIKEWLDENPYEVLTIMLEDKAQKSTCIGCAFYKSGMKDHVFQPEGEAVGVHPLRQWPTLKKMLMSGKRVVVFISGYDKDDPKLRGHDYLLHAEDHIFGTPQDTGSPDGFNCTVDQHTLFTTNTGVTAIPVKYALEKGYMPLLNHFIVTQIKPQRPGAAWKTIPDTDHINSTNSGLIDDAGSLAGHTANCTKEWNMKPLFLLVDIWHRGAVLEVADGLNGVNSTETIAYGRGTLKEYGGGIPGTCEQCEKCKKCKGSAHGGREKQTRGAMGALIAFFVAVLLIAG